MKASAGLAIISGTASFASSLRLVAVEAQNWQAFWGITFGAVTLIVFVWATIKNQKRKDAQFEEWKRRNDEKNDDP